MNKVISYLGFAKRANKIITGQTALRKTKLSLTLVLVCSSASENLVNLAKNLAVKHNCEYIITKISLAELIKQPDIKIVGILDENLSKAIIDNKEKISIG